MRLTSRHHQVAEHIACGETYAQAGRLVGVSRTTVMRWIKAVGFRELIESKQTESLEPLTRARQMLHAAVPDMVQTLVDVAGDTSARPSERINAATAVLDRRPPRKPHPPAVLDSPGPARDTTPMLKSLIAVLSAVRSSTRSRSDLLIEVTALRHQLAVYQRQGGRPKLTRRDRLFWIWLRRHWSRWRKALVIVQPETVLRWHREGYRAYWRRRSRKRPGRPRIPRRHIEFIRHISSDHPEWGEDRIALEMKLKLGVDHAASTVRRYMVERGGPRPCSTWRQFVSSHAHEFFALDFATQVLWNFEVRYVLVVMALDTRRVAHIAVTASPNLEWLKQQLRDAFGWDDTPRFLLHDNDGIFGQFGHTRLAGGRRVRCALDLWLANVMGVRGVPTPYGAPNANAHVERFIGTLRRECMDHFIFASEAHLRRTVSEFVRYYNEARPHQGIDAIPAGLNCAPPLVGEGTDLVATPVLGGLHHDYRLAA